MNRHMFPISHPAKHPQHSSQVWSSLQWPQSCDHNKCHETIFEFFLSKKKWKKHNWSILFSIDRDKFSFNQFKVSGNENNALLFKSNQNIYKLKIQKMHLRHFNFQAFLQGMPPNILRIFVAGWPLMQSWLKACLK